MLSADDAALEGAVNDLTDELIEAMDGSELEPVAAVCAALAAVFEHVQTEQGLAALRDLFEQFERARRTELGAEFFTPYQGVLQ